LKELWDIGEPTYDVSSNQTFTMHATLMWTINDFPVYGDVSGWSTKGRFACPCCMGNTKSKWLKYRNKFCYMGHRRFLPMDHRWRKEARSFDGTQELDHPPPMPTGDEIWRQVQGIDSVVEAIRKRLNVVQVGCDEQLMWKKRCILFTLPYWKNNMLCHNIDVMHIEKNMVDNIIGTLLNMENKTNDNLKARLNFKKIGLKLELHPVPRVGNKTYFPAACFTMTTKKKKDFLKVIQNIKVPDGYASNVSRCARVEECSLVV
jgi:hypothetical protein